MLRKSAVAALTAAFTFATTHSQACTVIDLKQAVAAAGAQIRTIKMGLHDQSVLESSSDFMADKPSKQAP